MSSIIFCFKSSETISITPVPQIPTGDLSAIVLIDEIFELSILTLQIAPATLPVPQEIFPPSKAGPAAVEVTSNSYNFV